MSHDVIQAGDQAYIDLDEDLFDFAGVARAAEAIEPDEDLDQLFASFRDALPDEELLTIPTAPATPAFPHAATAARALAAHASNGAPASPDPISPSRAPAPPKPAPAPRASEPVRALTPATRSSSLSKSVVAIALSVTILNSVLAVVVLRGRPGAGPARPQDLNGSLERDVQDEGGTLAAPPHGKSAALPDPEGVDPAHAHPALDEARAEISRGEYAGARQRVYGLLAIIDRLEDPRRGALEADCQFLIAQSLHLEALARMGGTR